MEESNKYYGYVRVSTSMQAEEGISLEAQRKKIEAWGVMNDKTLIKIFSDEGISGRDINKRHALKELMDVIQKGETLVVYSFSRLSRSVKDFLHITTTLDERGCKIVILKEGFDTSTPHGKFTATMLAAIAQLESDITSERVKDAMRCKIDKGEFVGRPPYGWRLSAGKGSDLVEVKEEQLIIRRIKEMRKIEIGGKAMSYQKIANKLIEDGIPPPGKSKKWHSSQIQRIAKRVDPITKGRGVKNPEIQEILDERERDIQRKRLDEKIKEIDKEIGLEIQTKSKVVSVKN